MMRTRQAPRDVAILASLAIPQEISLSVRTDEVRRGVDNVNSRTSGSKGDNVTLKRTGGRGVDNVKPSPPRRTFTDRIASSPQLVEATISRAIRNKAYREQAARPPVMAVRMAGSK
jgi:hypothetical protein